MRLRLFLLMDLTELVWDDSWGLFRKLETTGVWLCFSLNLNWVFYSKELCSLQIKWSPRNEVRFEVCLPSWTFIFTGLDSFRSSGWPDRHLNGYVSCSYQGSAKGLYDQIFCAPSYLSLIPQLYYTTAAMLLRSPGLPFTSSLQLLSVSVTSHSSSGLGVGLL